MIIYKTINLINGKFYIGKDINNNPNYLGSGKILKIAIDKYGVENFRKEIIEICNSIEELNEREKFWIKELNAIGDGYNISYGGDGGNTIENHPNKKEISNRHSEWMKNNNPMKGRKRTKEEIDKWRISYGDSSGDKNPNYGRKCSEECKEKISRKNKGRYVSDETRKKISEANMGRESTLKGIKNPRHSEWMKNNNPMKGKSHTDESKMIISELNKHPKEESTKKKISDSLKEYYNNGNRPVNTKKIYIDGEIFDGYAEASKKLNIPIGTIRNRIKSKNYPNYYHL